ncbi:MAG TPA: dihydrofolate reductase [Candidatus Saccharimonadales bacterium]|nr:dihydrofolate reductase [Candidatus Saccharimonadales bacterium]
MIRLIAAIDRERGIAKRGVIPWHIPEDAAFFDSETKKFGGKVLSGGVTFRVGYGGHPLAGRQNYILTHDPQPIEGATVIHDIAQFLEKFEGDLWVAGGAAVFEEVMELGYADELYLTHVDASFGCDRFFPEYEGSFTQIEQSEPKEQNGFTYRYTKYRRSA